MAITSTVPGAISTLQGYMTTVADANPSLECQVFLGEPVAGETTDNFMAIGDPNEWLPIKTNSYQWAAVPGTAMRRSESYALQGTIRCWAGNSDPLCRLDDAFNLLNGLHAQIVADIRGSGTLTSSGSWGNFVVTMESFGPLENQGWGVVLGLELHVINAEIIG